MIIIDRIYEYLGVSAWLLLLIPLVLLVRLLFRRSRWSILRMTLVSLTGVAIVSLWLTFLETIADIETTQLSGKLGAQLSVWLSSKTDGVVPSFIISTTFLFLWIFFALMDAIISATRFFHQ